MTNLLFDHPLGRAAKGAVAKAAVGVGAGVVAGVGVVVGVVVVDADAVRVAEAKVD